MTDEAVNSWDYAKRVAIRLGDVFKAESETEDFKGGGHVQLMAGGMIALLAVLNVEVERTEAQGLAMPGSVLRMRDAINDCLDEMRRARPYFKGGSLFRQGEEI